MCKNFLTWKNSSQASETEDILVWWFLLFRTLGEAKMSQSAVFPFFHRLLRQEVFPGKPKGVADQLPIDLLALPEKAPCVTLIIFYLFGLWLCKEEKKWTNSTVPQTASLLEAQMNRFFLLLRNIISLDNLMHWTIDDTCKSKAVLSSATLLWQVNSMTELFRTLRIAEEICLKLSFISDRAAIFCCVHSVMYFLAQKLVGMTACRPRTLWICTLPFGSSVGNARQVLKLWC